MWEFFKSGFCDSDFFGDLFDSFGKIDTHLLGVTFAVVAIILIVVYRSPVLWIFPLFSALMAESLAGAVIYVLAKNNILTLDGLASGVYRLVYSGPEGSLSESFVIR